MFAVGVKFRNNGEWSHVYTYQSTVALAKDSIVLVGTGDFFSVGKVIGCKPCEEYKARPGVKYRSVISDLSEVVK